MMILLGRAGYYIICLLLLLYVVVVVFCGLKSNEN